MSWQNEFSGDMDILVWDPPRHLRTAWAFHEHDRQAPQVTDYHVTGQGGTTRVRVVTSGFPDDPSWDGWIEGTVRGWRFELRSLKEYLESFPGRDRRCVYLRRRVDLPDGEAWSRLFPAGGGPALSDISGRPVDHEEGRQHAVVIEDPKGALMRVSMEPTGMGATAEDVTIWLSAWDADAERLAALEETWHTELTRLFPEGEAV